MRVLILGGSSFMGPATVQRLLERGCEVALFNRGEREQKKTLAFPIPSQVRRFAGNRRDLAASAEELRAFKPEVVLDMIAMSEADARALMDVFRGVARRTVVLSSMDVYRSFGLLFRRETGKTLQEPETEDSPVREEFFLYKGKMPKGDDYEKILAERVVFSEPEAFPSTVLRLPMVFGPGDDQRRIFPYLKRMDDGRPAIPLGEKMARWRTTRGYVEDAAEAIAACVLDDRAANRLYNVGYPEHQPEREWVELIAQAAGWSGKIVEVPDEKLEDEASEVDMTVPLVVDASRIRRELSLPPLTPIDEALRRTVAWDRAHLPAALPPEMFNYEREDVLMAEATKA
jgi:nucleoside-diphosphate-sugar epimerase